MKIEMCILAGVMLLGSGTGDIAQAPAGREHLSIGATVVAPCIIRSVPAQVTCAHNSLIYKARRPGHLAQDDASMVQSNMADNASYVEVAL